MSPCGPAGGGVWLEKAVRSPGRCPRAHVCPPVCSRDRTSASRHSRGVARRLTRVLRLFSAVELCAVTWLLFKPSLEEFLVFVIFQKKILHSKVK